MFYVIEGLDGTGKSTQLELLRQRVPGARFLSFPNYESKSGQLIKEYLSGGFSAEDDCWLPSLLYAADRCITMRGSFQSALKDGSSGTEETVISARYTTSNAIYQGAKLPAHRREKFFKYIYDLEYNKLGLPKPDKIIFLYLPEKLQWHLLEKRNTKTNGGTETDFHETIEFQRQCRDCAGFLALRDSWRIINCADSSAGGEKIRSSKDINDDIIKEIL